MKIIFKGKDPSKTPMIGTCNNCKTQVEFTADDPGVGYTFVQRDGGYYHFECPVCKKQILRGNATGNLYDQ